MSPASKILLVVMIIVIGGGFYFLQQQKNKPSESAPKNSQIEENILNQSSNNFSIITIVVPENYDLYTQKMTESVQGGGDDALKTMRFIKKEITIPYTNDLIKASAKAAAEEISPVGGPTKASVAYLEVQNNTAYVLLDIDLDGWPGVSASLAIIHPLVERTLMQFSEINNVIFGYAPGEK